MKGILSHRNINIKVCMARHLLLERHGFPSNRLSRAVEASCIAARDIATPAVPDLLALLLAPTSGTCQILCRQALAGVRVESPSSQGSIAMYFSHVLSLLIRLPVD